MDLVTVVTIARMTAGGVLLFAGLMKLRIGLDAFAAAVRAFRILPFGVGAFARVVVTLELVTGAALVLHLSAQTASAVALALVVLFSAALGIALRRGQRHGCGCGSGSIRSISYRLIARNGVLAALLVTTLVWEGIR